MKRFSVMVLMIASSVMCVRCSDEAAVTGPAENRVPLKAATPSGSVGRVIASQIVMKGLSVEEIENALHKLHDNSYNAVLLAISNSVSFNSMPPSMLRDDAISVSDFLQIVNLARSLDLEVIPELRLLTHQNKEFFVPGSFDHLLLNDKTYNPEKDSVYTIVFPIIDEIDNLIHPKFFSIGHDEVAGHGDNTDYELLDADLFLMDVKKLHSHISRKGITTVMYGDMFLRRESFPEMFHGALNGNIEYENLILSGKIPKSIVIIDWHYRNHLNTNQYPYEEMKFTSTNWFIDHGYKVIGGTFRDLMVTEQFANHFKDLQSQGNPLALGMVATTWSTISGRPELYDSIVVQSSKYFRGTAE